MKKLIEKLGLTVLQSMALGLLGLAAGIFSLLWKEISAPLLEKVIPEISPGTLLSIILLLFVICTLQTTWIFYLHKKQKIKLSNYKLVKDKGYYVHKKTGVNYCGICLHDGKLSPLSRTTSTHLFCCYRCDKKIIK